MKYSYTNQNSGETCEVNEILLGIHFHELPSWTETPGELAGTCNVLGDGFILLEQKLSADDLKEAQAIVARLKDILLKKLCVKELANANNTPA